MSKFVTIAALLLIAACTQPAAENAGSANIADPEITEVPDESGDGLFGIGNEGETTNDNDTGD